MILAGDAGVIETGINRMIIVYDKAGGNMGIAGTIADQAKVGAAAKRKAKCIKQD